MSDSPYTRPGQITGASPISERQDPIAGTVSDTAYGPGWNGVTTVAPSKNAVYDKIQTILGDVVGPASATDNAIVRFDGTTGKLIQNSGISIDDSNELDCVGAGGLVIKNGVARILDASDVGAGATGNYVRVENAASGSDPQIVVSANADAAVDLNIVPVGTGHLQVNGVNVLVSGGPLGTPSSGTLTNCTGLPVAGGGTGVSSIAALSIWLANSANVITSVTPGAGQSIRINAGNTAWEAYTPGSGGGHTIKDEGGAGLTARTYLNFIGAGVAATDNAGTDSTDVTIPADMILASTQTITGAKTFGTIGGAVGKLILAGSTSGSTILNAAAVAGSGTITLPTGTDTLAGLATAQTWTAAQTFGTTTKAQFNDANAYINASAQGAMVIDVGATGAKTITIGASATGGVTIGSTGNLTLNDGVHVIVGSSTGTKWGTASTQKQAWWNATPIVQPSAYTQTFSTASRTMAAATVGADIGAFTNPPTAG